jgi:hypothetical protein
MAFIGIAGWPPVTGPDTNGRATAVFSGSIDGALKTVVDDGEAACLLDDEQPVANTSTATPSVPTAARTRPPPRSPFRHGA